MYPDCADCRPDNQCKPGLCIPCWNKQPYIIRMQLEQIHLDIRKAVSNLLHCLVTAGAMQRMYLAGAKYGCYLSDWHPNAKGEAL